MCIIGVRSTPVTYVPGQTSQPAHDVKYSCGGHMRWTDRPWWSVEDAARLLRVNVHTLYRAVQANDFPHSKVGPYIRIPAEALLLTPRPDTLSHNWHVDMHAGDDQLAFEFDPPIIPVKLYRNGEPRRLGDYEISLSNARRWRNERR